jgi:hypothetical protein
MRYDGDIFFFPLSLLLFVSASVNESKEWAPPKPLHFCEAKQKNYLGENVPRMLFSGFWKFSHRFWNNCDSPTFIEYFLKILKYSKCWAQLFFFKKTISIQKDLLIIGHGYSTLTISLNKFHYAFYTYTKC